MLDKKLGVSKKIFLNWELSRKEDFFFLLLPARNPGKHSVARL
jgi:hypothetical protein